MEGVEVLEIESGRTVTQQYGFFFQYFFSMDALTKHVFLDTRHDPSKLFLF